MLPRTTQHTSPHCLSPPLLRETTSAMAWQKGRGEKVGGQKYLSKLAKAIYQWTHKEPHFIFGLAGTCPGRGGKD